MREFKIPALSLKQLSNSLELGRDLHLKKQFCFYISWERQIYLNYTASLNNSGSNLS